MDRWIRSRLSTLVAQVREDLDAYEITRASRAIGEFIIDDISNWYVRRSRDRFWGSISDEETRSAFTTLGDVLITIARLLAPITPFQADWLHRAIAGTSVHLARYPDAAQWTRDEPLEQGMGAIRSLARLGRAARERVKVRVRQPLRTLHAFTPVQDLPEELVAVLRDELNVKEVRFLQRSEELVALKAHPNFRVLGKRFGGKTQEAAARIRDLSSAGLSAFRAGNAPITIEVGGEKFELNADEFEIREEPRGDLVVESDEGCTVALDPHIDDELRLEGIAREVMSRIQRLRRDSGLEVSDRIRLVIAAEGEALTALQQHREYVARETLAAQVELTELGSGLLTKGTELELDGLRLRIGIEKMA
jgi:isoleucyl-tRNA synthetase